MPNIFSHLIHASLCLGGLFASNAQAQQHIEGKYIVVAIAVDIQSVVIRDPSGHTRLYGIGDRLFESQWRLLSTSSDGLELQAMDRLHGSVVNLQLRAGESFDPQMLSASLQREGEPLYRTEQMIQRKAVGSSAERN